MIQQIVNTQFHLRVDIGKNIRIRTIQIPKWFVQCDLVCLLASHFKFGRIQLELRTKACAYLKNSQRSKVQNTSLDP